MFLPAGVVPALCLVGCFANYNPEQGSETAGTSSTGADQGTGSLTAATASSTQNSDTESSAESTDSMGTTADAAGACGDGTLDPDEACDDGNLANDDGCDEDCLPSEVVEIHGAGAHFCVLSRAGSVFCWGDNSIGQLGAGNTENIGDSPDERPVGPLELGGPVASLDVGDAQACALLVGGEITCWGSLVQATLGDEPGEMPPPAIEVGTETPVSIASGSDHNCALFESGDVRCWGRGNFGGPGQGNTDDIVPNILVPAPVVDLGKLPPDLLTCGPNSCCAAASRTSEVRCWGSNDQGILGVGLNPNDNIGDEQGEMPPSIVETSVVSDIDALAMNSSTCWVSPLGELYCWGGNSAGQLGTGDLTDVLGGASDLPVRVPLGLSTVSVTVGAQHICALSNVGEVRCSGSGFRGANGAGTNEDIGQELGGEPPPPVELPAPALLIGSASYSTCAWLQTRELWCWGDNEAGQLGQGDRLPIGDDEPPSAGSPVPLFSGRTFG